MKKPRITVFTCLAFLALLMTILATTVFGFTGVRGGIAHAATANKCGQWSIIPSANPTLINILTDVAVIAANDVWAVGLDTSNQGFSQTLAEHWNGKAWKVVVTPNIGPYGNYLRSVAALSTNNVWAVGYYQSKSTADHTLIEHWDGSAWSIVASPRFSADPDSLLYHVAAVAPDDIWAVGSFANRALIEHWDGKEWKVVPVPTVKYQSSALTSITVVSKNDIWGVGEAFGSSSSHTLIEHWNGSSWQIIASPNSGNLWGVAAVSSNDIWAVGDTSNNNQPKTLIEHWDGNAWKMVTSPTPMSQLSHQTFATPQFGEGPNTLQGLAVVSANDIWAVGNYVNSSGIYQTLIEHWNGKQWSVVASPNLGSDYTSLWGATRVGNTTDVWAVGYGTNGSSSSTLTEYYC